jgi:hypothetical protein
LILLKDKLVPSHYSALQKVFPDIPLDTIRIEYTPRDGKLRALSMIKINLFKASRCIYLDSADWDKTAFIDPVPSSESTAIDQAVAICHELIHIRQTRRGFWERLKMIWWGRTSSYWDRPHEIEAHTFDDASAFDWLYHIDPP